MNRAETQTLRPGEDSPDGSTVEIVLTDSLLAAGFSPTPERVASAPEGLTFTVKKDIRDPLRTTTWLWFFSFLDLRPLGFEFRVNLWNVIAAFICLAWALNKKPGSHRFSEGHIATKLTQGELSRRIVEIGIRPSRFSRCAEMTVTLEKGSQTLLARGLSKEHYADLRNTLKRIIKQPVTILPPRTPWQIFIGAPPKPGRALMILIVTLAIVGSATSEPKQPEVPSGPTVEALCPSSSRSAMSL
jgi:hypothetical protein